MKKVKNMVKVVNIKNSNCDVYIGRGKDGRHMNNTDIGERGWLGNPYKIGRYTSRKESVILFKIAFLDKIEKDDEFKDAVLDLEGSILGCYCKPKLCHGDIIVEYIKKRKSD